MNGAILQRKDALIDSWLIGIPAFRSAVLSALADTHAIGTLARGADPRYLDLRWNNGGGYGVPLPRDLKAGDFATPQPLRCCDAFAFKLSEIEGMPEFMFYASVAKRDAEIRTIIDLLTRYGARYACTPAADADPLLSLGRIARAYMSFPRLDHPATADEVAQGRAIFAFPAGSETRQVQLPAFPLPANWIKLKKYPYDSSTYTRNWKLVYCISYDQHVQVWQAEEQRVHGRWERFFGVVGKHELAMVPAADIEFNTSHAGSLTNGIDCWLSRPDDDNCSAGVPKTIIATLHNRRGVAQRVPIELFRPGKHGKPALRQGVELQLTYTPNRQDATPRPSPYHIPARSFPAPQKNRWRLTNPSSPVNLISSPGSDLRRSGSYMPHLHFTQASGIGEGYSNELIFYITTLKSGIIP